MITELERKCLDAFGEAWNLYVSLSEEHPADLGEARVYLHAIQNIILARSAYRELASSLPSDRRIPYFPKQTRE